MGCTSCSVLQHRCLQHQVCVPNIPAPNRRCSFPTRYLPLLNLTSHTLSPTPSPTNSRAPQSPLSPYRTPSSPLSPPLVGPILNLAPTRPIPTFTWNDLPPPPADGSSPSPQPQFAPYSVPVILPPTHRLPLLPRCHQAPAPMSQNIQGDFLMDWWKPDN